MSGFGTVVMLPVCIRLEMAGIASEVRPIAPVRAVRVLAVFCVVLLREALRIGPNRLHNPRPRIANADIAGGVLPGLHLFSVFIPNDGINSQRRGASTSGLHRI